MKTRIALVIAILAGLTITGLNVVIVRGKISKLQSNLKEQTDSRLKAETDLVNANGNLERIASALDAAKTENRTLVAEAGVQAERIDSLSKAMTVVRQDLDRTKAELGRIPEHSGAEYGERVHTNQRTARTACRDGKRKERLGQDCSKVSTAL